MVSQLAGRTFISYSRRDGAEYSAWLRAWLGERDLSVWQDIVALEGGLDWWSQIEDALKSKALQHFILVVTPGALASSVVRREIRLGRQEGKTVCPVKGTGLQDLGQLPRWLGQVYDLDLIEHQTSLIRVLEADSRQKRVPMMAPEPPEDFVPRPKEFDALKKQLLDTKGDAVAAITAALKGAGGYGKTTLAKALAHDPDIQDAYFDGLLWAELGEKPERLLSILTDQIEVLTGERPGLETINAAAGKLGEALGDRRILMIIDDAWREQDLRPFLQGGPNCVRLVTTRIDSVLPQTAMRQPVDAMQAREALSLLSAGLPEDQVSGERENLKKLTNRLGEWAQLLKIVNGFLRHRTVKTNEALSAAIAGANRRLDAKGLVVFDARNETDRAKAVARTIGVSLDLLSEKEQAQFGELGVFPEDAEIPIGVVLRLWAATGKLEDFETEDLLNRLFDLSLLLELDLGQRFIRLHDTTRQFLQDRVGRDGLVAQHGKLVAALDGVANERTEAQTGRYFYLNLPYHLAEAREGERLNALLLDPAWLRAKLEATANPHSLVADYERYGVSEAQSLIGRILRLISGICARDERQLLPQLIGRLMGFEPIVASGFLDEARRVLLRPAIVPIWPSLTPPGVETARLEAHSHVRALCIIADGRLASGSGWEVQLWDVAAAVETRRLEGHHNTINALCQLPDGRLASGSGELLDSHDNTIRLWDIATGTESARLEGHGNRVAALCLLEDGRLASGSDDRTIRLWDVTTGVETARLDGHDGSVGALCVLPDGRLASGSRDKTILLWDVATGAETARLDGHDAAVEALCVLADGRLASGSDDKTIRLWDVTTCAEVARFKSHSHWVSALCPLSDGRLASGSYDETIRLWDVSNGAENVLPGGHTTWVRAICQLADGRLASGSDDRTIRLWDVSSKAAGVQVKQPITRSGVSALCLVPGGLIASGFDDGTIRLWDPSTKAECARLPGHAGQVSAFCLLRDGRLASGSHDHTIRLWDLTSCAETGRLEGHDSFVTALCLLADGRLASGSWDRTIRLWDVMVGAESDVLQGHADDIAALCLLGNGRLAASYMAEYAESESTIRIWDLTTRGETARLEGHFGFVEALSLLPDGRLASGALDTTIRLWDVAAGVETAQLGGDFGPVTSLSALPNGLLASGTHGNVLQLWDSANGSEIARLHLDAPVTTILSVTPNVIVAGDRLGMLHWLEIVD